MSSDGWCRRSKKTKDSQTTRTSFPVRRPSGGVAQGDEPHGCGERLKGPWMALVSRPPERHRSEGSLSRRPDPDAGVAFFGYFLLARQEKVTRRARRNLSLRTRKARRGCRTARQRPEKSVPFYLRKSGPVFNLNFTIRIRELLFKFVNFAFLDLIYPCGCMVFELNF